MHGSYSRQWQIGGRELLMPDEVRMLNNSLAILFIRGERPVKDLKYNIGRHPNIALSADGGADTYIHGKDTLTYADIVFDNHYLAEAQTINVDVSKYELLSETELEEMLERRNDS